MCINVIIGWYYTNNSFSMHVKDLIISLSLAEQVRAAFSTGHWLPPVDNCLFLHSYWRLDEVKLVHIADKKKHLRGQGKF